MKTKKKKLKTPIKSFIYKIPKRKTDVKAYATLRSSSKDKKIIYTIVKYIDKSILCTCPDYIFRRRECKHINYFKKYEKVRRLK